MTKAEYLLEMINEIGNQRGRNTANQSAFTTSDAKDRRAEERRKVISTPETERRRPMSYSGSHNRRK